METVATEAITDPDKYIKLGSVLPKGNLAWRNNFIWKNFTAGFLISARLGGVVYSRTQAMLDYYGVSEASADARDLGYVLVNGRDKVNPETWYGVVGSGTSVSPILHLFCYQCSSAGSIFGLHHPQKVVE